MCTVRSSRLTAGGWAGERNAIRSAGRGCGLPHSVDKGAALRAENGEIVAQGSAPHPPGTECHPRHWWTALQQAGNGLLEQAAAIAIAGQQHGMVVLDADDEVIRPALLWNDLRSAPQAAALVAEFGGPRWWAERTGSVPGASFTVTKLRWLAEHEPPPPGGYAGSCCRTTG